MKLTFLLSLLLALGSTGCSTASHSPEGISRAFMETYYERADLKYAQHLVTGVAAQKIGDQLALGGGLAEAEQFTARRITFSRLPGTLRNGERPEIFYELEIQVEKQPRFRRRVRLTLEQDRSSRTWSIANFVETPA